MQPKLSDGCEECVDFLNGPLAVSTTSLNRALLSCYEEWHRNRREAPEGAPKCVMARQTGLIGAGNSTSWRNACVSVYCQKCPNCWILISLTRWSESYMNKATLSTKEIGWVHPAARIMRTVQFFVIKTIIRSDGFNQCLKHLPACQQMPILASRWCSIIINRLQLAVCDWLYWLNNHNAINVKLLVLLSGSRLVPCSISTYITTSVAIQCTMLLLPSHGWGSLTCWIERMCSGPSLYWAANWLPVLWWRQSHGRLPWPIAAPSRATCVKHCQ